MDGKGRAARKALLVVAAGTEIRSAAELSGKVVAFGPRENARTHLAAMQLIREAGLQRTDLALELLPVPGSLKHMPDGRAVAQTVINGSAAAGFIDEAAWETLAEHPTQVDEPARDQLRVIGQTVAVPDRLWVVSPQLDDATLKSIQGFLLALGPDDADTLKPLNASGFRAPDEETLAACRRLAAAKPARAVADQQPVSGNE